MGFTSPLEFHTSRWQQGLREGRLKIDVHRKESNGNYQTSGAWEKKEASLKSVCFRLVRASFFLALPNRENPPAVVRRPLAPWRRRRPLVFAAAERRRAEAAFRLRAQAAEAAGGAGGRGSRRATGDGRAVDIFLDVSQALKSFSGGLAPRENEPLPLELVAWSRIGRLVIPIYPLQLRKRAQTPRRMGGFFFCGLWREGPAWREWFMYGENRSALCEGPDKIVHLFETAGNH